MCSYVGLVALKNQLDSDLKALVNILVKQAPSKIILKFLAITKKAKI